MLPAVVLASRSPRRLALLRAAGVSVRTRAVACDERRLREEAALEHARRLAEAKLRTALREGGDECEADEAWLAADTVVWHPADGVPLGKPEDREDAARIIRSLTNGGAHCVTTAWALAFGPAPVEVHHETTRVLMRPLAPDELEAYLAGDEWRDKAGGYGIQGSAAGWVRELEGSYTNVVGLPVAQVLERLHAGPGREESP